jgi:ADP-ribose pyrophosphatase YjhB (NUDIX family)
MMPLRLGIACAVIDDGGRVLLSKRADFGIWNLPGGRLDAGELLADGAAREVREETGVVAHVDRAVGLYFSEGRSRMSVVYAGWPLGGVLKQRTDETLENRYFAQDALPKMMGEGKVRDVFMAARPLPTIEIMPVRNRRIIQFLLGWRWVKNFLSGRPEPRFPEFHIRAVGVIWDSSHKRALTLSGKHERVLPRVVCEGQQAPWKALRDSVQQQCGVSPTFHWVGIWQDAPRNLIEFVFAATLPETNLPDDGEWSVLQNAALGDRDLTYTQRVKSTYVNDPVWTILHDDSLVRRGGVLRAIDREV